MLANEVFDSLNYEFDVNVYGLVRMIREFVPVLEANGGGAFVQLNSVVSVKSFADFATYSASKAAAYSLTQALRDSLAGKSIQVMSVHPGPIMTDMGKAAGLEEIAEPASVVSEAIVTGLADGSFHVFPDSYAKNVWQAYEEFAKAVVEAQGE